MVRTTTPTYRFHDARLIISPNPSLKFSPPFLPVSTLPTNTKAFFDSLRRLVPFARFLLWSSIVTPLAKWEKSDGVSLIWRWTFCQCRYSKVSNETRSWFSWYDVAMIENDWTLILLYSIVRLLWKNLSILYKTVFLQNYFFRNNFFKMTV